MKKLTNYKYTTKVGDYISERINVDKGVYDFKIFSDENIIAEEKDVNVKTGRDLEKYIREVIKKYEKDLETEEVDEVEEDDELEEIVIDELNDLQEGITEVLAEEELKEEVDEVEEEVDISEIDAVFTKRKSPIEMKELFESLDLEIRKIKGVNFKTTTLDLVYQTSGMNFLRIRPLTNRLTIMTAPDYYDGIVKITEESEIDDAMVSIKESYEYIREKRSNKNK